MSAQSETPQGMTTQEKIRGAIELFKAAKQHEQLMLQHWEEAKRLQQQAYTRLLEADTYAWADAARRVEK